MFDHIKNHLKYPNECVNTKDQLIEDPICPPKFVNFSCIQCSFYMFQVKILMQRIHLCILNDSLFSRPAVPMDREQRRFIIFQELEIYFNKVELKYIHVPKAGGERTEQRNKKSQERTQSTLPQLKITVLAGSVFLQMIICCIVVSTIFRFSLLSF